MSEKRKIVVISDHPLVPSGVGTQTKYVIEGLLRTGRYSFVCMGGAIDHPDFTPQKVEPDKYGDDWLIYPTKGYGDKDSLRRTLAREKPDALLIVTDPRFYVWLWEMEDEVRRYCPLVYWHVWDNDPTPKFNKVFYDSTDHVAAISLKTFGLLQDMDLRDGSFSYIPHALPADIFKPVSEDEVKQFRRDHLGQHADRRFIVFWNNRNARRKQTGDVIAAFAQFAREVGKDNVALFMHTNPKDEEGQDVVAVARCYDIESSLVISNERLPPDILNMFYNSADVTINIASNEGFGLSTLESLYAGTPIVAHFTGGLQFQLGNWWEGRRDFTDQEAMTNTAKRFWKNPASSTRWWGFPVFPASRSCTGSQQIPYIYDDRVSHEDVVEGLRYFYKRTRSERKEMGAEARKWALCTFAMDAMIERWDRTLTDVIDTRRANGHSGLRFATI